MSNRARCCLAFFLLLSLIASGAVAAPSLPPTGAVRIESLTHNVQTPLRAGDTIRVTLRGSAGGTATFHLFGVATDVKMGEIRPGVYQAQPAVYTGFYTVRPGDSARNAALFATLRVGEREVMASSNRLITIGTRPPTITAQRPQPQAGLVNTRPNIVVHFFDAESGINPRAVRLIVNGQDVSARASVTETSASYNPEVPFNPGPVRVRIMLADWAKNTHSAEWTFTVAPSQELIKSVTINPTTALKADDVLTVVMTGIPAGEAFFVIEGLPDRIPMRESRTPGFYFGSYAARAGQRILDAALVVTLSKGGQRSSVAATPGLTILTTPPPAPTISAPGRAVALGASVAVRTVLRGRTQPGFRILGRISYEAKLPFSEDQGPLGEFSAVAGADGSWQAALGPLIPLRGAKLMVTAVAIDPAGQRSPAAVLEMNQQ